MSSLSIIILDDIYLDMGIYSESWYIYMGWTLIKTILIVLAIVLFIYLILGTFGFFKVGLKKNRAKKSIKSKEKIENIKLRTIKVAKNYWYNLREAEDLREDEKIESIYHYFDAPDDCIHDLILEMYDCGLVRTEELIMIANGHDVDYQINPILLESLLMQQKMAKTREKSTLNQLTNQIKEDMSQEDVKTASEAVEEVDEKKDVVDSDIKDEDTKEEQDKSSDNKDNEESNKDSEMSSKNSDISNKESEDIANQAVIKANIYEKWVGYVMQLYQQIEINSNEEDMKHIRKELMAYGHNDIDILLHSPE